MRSPQIGADCFPIERATHDTITDWKECTRETVGDKIMKVFFSRSIPGWMLTEEWVRDESGELYLGYRHCQQTRRMAGGAPVLAAYTNAERKALPKVITAIVEALRAGGTFPQAVKTAKAALGVSNSSLLREAEARARQRLGV